MLDFHGSTLTTLYMHWHSQNQVAALATLLERQRSLEQVYVADPEALPSLAVVIAQGCLRHVQKLEIWLFKDGYQTVTSPQIFGVASAMQVPGALDALVSLHFYSEDELPDDTFPLLVGSLASGAAPSLCHLDFGSSRLAQFDDEEMEALVEMVEARAALFPACRRWKVLEGNEGVCELAQAIDTLGLPMLRKFDVRSLALFMSNASSLRALASGRWLLLLSGNVLA